VLHVANQAMVDLYWRIGEYISLRVAKSSWGKGVVAELANYIASVVPESKGYSASNLWRMKQFYETYAGNEKLATLLRELSWSNNLVIMSRSKSAEEREFYIRLANKERLSNRDLVRQFKACTFERTMLGNAKLAPVLRELSPQAETVFKDNYVLEFIILNKKSGATANLASPRKTNTLLKSDDNLNTFCHEELYFVTSSSAIASS